MWRRVLALAAVALCGCAHVRSKQVIVIGVDGMDPGFVEAHWADLPNLKQMRFSRLGTTTPPQSPVAWSTFATGLDPAEHGIFDFVHRDPVTHAPFLSTDRTDGPRFQIGIGPYVLPLSGSRVTALRHGRPFWQTLADRGVPVTVIRMPANYPPTPVGLALSGMGTPDLRGTQGTFQFFTDDPDEVSRDVSGGEIRTVALVNGHCDLRVEGPANSLRKDRRPSAVNVAVDLDPDQPYARFRTGGEDAILRQGEWSDWIGAEFKLIPHMASVRGMFRVYAKQLRPRLEIYVSPVNADPAAPALPTSYPASFARRLAEEIGPFSTLGIPEDTSALRQGVLELGEFLTQSGLVLNDERRMLDNALKHFSSGLLFFYFSSVDQNSHILWRKHDDELLKVYRAVDECVGRARRQFPMADVMVMSDHGFTSFDRAVNLNRWLTNRGFGDKAYAVGLNALYLKEPGAKDGLIAQLLAWRDSENGRAVVETVERMRPTAENAKIAPDLIVGYARGYRASWRTGLGETADAELENNNEAWIADHCVNAADVPGVLFTSWDYAAAQPTLKELGGAILRLFEAHTED